METLIAIVMLVAIAIFLPLANGKVESALLKRTDSASLDAKPGNHAGIACYVAISCLAIVLLGHLISAGICQVAIDACKVSLAPIDFRIEYWLRGVIDLMFSAILEEAIFRGYLLAWLIRKMTLPPAITMQALGFAFAHFLFSSNLSPLFLIPMFLFGVTLGQITVTSRSIWPACIAHAAYNISFAIMGSFALSGTKYPLLELHYSINHPMLAITCWIWVSAAMITLARFWRVPAPSSPAQS